MNNKARLTKLENKHNDVRSQKNHWTVAVINSNGEVVEHYHYPSREKVSNEH